MKKKETKEAVYMQPKLVHKASSLILRLKKTIARTKTVKNEK
jgi:ribosomal protein L29